MKFTVGRLAWAAALAWAGWYTICAFLVAVAPTQFQSVLSYVFHYELAGSRPITLGSYLLGMIGTGVWVAAVAATFAGIHNALGRDRRVAVFPERSAARVG